MALLSVEALRDDFAKIQEGDLVEMGALCLASENGERIRLGVKPNRKLTNGQRESVFSWIAGVLQHGPADT